VPWYCDLSKRATKIIDRLATAGLLASQSHRILLHGRDPARIEGARRALAGEGGLSADAAYAQSKLALTMWSRSLAQELGDSGPVIVAVNPGSMLGTKMVQQAFGVAGGDVGLGAEILRRAALDEDFAAASGQYFDNDSGRFAPPHPDALDAGKPLEILRSIETVLEQRVAER